MGAVILPLMGIYLLLLIVGTAYGWRWAKRRGYSTIKRVLCAFGGFLIVYLPLMWDWIPTELAHRYYCKKEAGLWIYKTLDQWKAENPGVYETLVVDDKSSSRVGDDINYEDIIRLNQRINNSLTRKKLSSVFPIFRKTYMIIDTKNNEVLGKYINISYGYPGSLALGGSSEEGIYKYKFWMSQPYCVNGISNKKVFSNFSDSFKGARK